MSNRPVRIQKRLLQYNGVPFAFGEISDPSYSIATKGEIQNYTNNTHGAYLPTIGESQKLEPSTFRANISFDFRRISCEDKVRYARFIKRQLLIPGKLWAVQNAVELLWTNGRVVDITENVDDPSTRDMFNVSITFELPDGYWRMAKPTRTFLCEYCPNRYHEFDPNFCEDMYDYNGVCDSTGQSNCVPCVVDMGGNVQEKTCDWKPLCSYPLYNKRAHYVTDPTNPTRKLQEFIPSRYDMFGINCSNQYYIRYDCELEQETFCYDGSWGRKFRVDTTKPGQPYTFSYCSRTDLPTDKVRIRLVGTFNTPKITINGDYIKVGVNSNGLLSLGYGPTGYTTPDKTDADSSLRAPIDTYLTRSNTPAFEVTAGRNCVTIEGAEFGEDCWIYIDTVDITW